MSAHSAHDETRQMTKHKLEFSDIELRTIYAALKSQIESHRQIELLHKGKESNMSSLGMKFAYLADRVKNAVIGRTHEVSFLNNLETCIEQAKQYEKFASAEQEALKELTELMNR